MQALITLIFGLVLSSPTANPLPMRLDCEWLKLATPATECTLAGGWELAAHGQRTGDPGFYRFALAIAREFQDRPRQRTEAVLLKGYAMQQLHRFDEAYRVVEPLLASAPLASVHQLLGDIRLEQGRLEQAADHYQQQLNLKPSPAAYTRGAQVRFLAGDVPGALELLALALEGAARSSDRRELAFALRLGGRFLLARGDFTAAVRMLKDSVQLAPTPGSRLLLAQAQLAAGNERIACGTLTDLSRDYPAPDAVAWLEGLPACVQAGAEDLSLPAKARRLDARGYARYLLANGREIATAAALLKGELTQRRDPVTLALAAWADLESGRAAAAALKTREALARPYPEPLPYLIAALVAEQRQHFQLRDQHLARVSQQIFLLSPREREIYARLNGSAFKPQDS